VCFYVSCLIMTPPNNNNNQNSCIIFHLQPTRTNPSGFFNLRFLSTWFLAHKTTNNITPNNTTPNQTKRNNQTDPARFVFSKPNCLFFVNTATCVILHLLFILLNNRHDFWFHINYSKHIIIINYGFKFLYLMYLLQPDVCWFIMLLSFIWFTHRFTFWLYLHVNAFETLLFHH